MGSFQDLTGRVFGKWSVLRKSDKRGPRGETLWVCRCECGTSRDVRATNLVTGRSSSCGCSATHKSALTHGHTVNREISPTYHTWAGMKARCTNPNHSHFRYYGAVGISICDRWESFENFLTDMGEKPAGMSLDRIDTSGPYSPENCRWASNSTQANNKSNNRLITAFGETLTLQQWANRIGVSHGTIIFRIDRGGWPVEAAVSTPSRGYGGRKSKNSN